jgi:predicted AlkP superfamily pyrophosphatase or phosphodiesterase
VFLVLDGLPVEAVGREVTPVLVDWCAASGTAPHAVRAVLPAATYPNHASFVTGVEPSVHGIVGNHVPDETGRMRPASTVGPAVPTMFDAVTEAGLECRVVVGDQELVGVMGARTATSHWPPGGQVPEGAATDAHGYLHDDVTLPELLDALASDADLLFGHLNAPDTAGHVHGPSGAHDVYRATDARLAAIRATVEQSDDPPLVIVVSDHSMEPVTEPEPVDLTPALDGTGLTWMPEGTAAVVYGDHPDVAGLLPDTPGVEGVLELAPARHLVWAEPGRWLCFAGIDGEPGMHGSPRTDRQLAAVVGSDPAVAELDALVAAGGFDATRWFGEILRLLDVEQAPA